MATIATRPEMMTRETLERIERLRGLALSALPRMFVDEAGLFCWCVRRRGDGAREGRGDVEGRNGVDDRDGRDGRDRIEGQSFRYTAITLIGLAEVDRAVADTVVPGGARDCCEGLLRRLDEIRNVGDVALAVWAGVAWGCDGASAALERLEGLADGIARVATVELSWVVSALSLGADCDRGVLDRVAGWLMGRFQPSSHLFPHGGVRLGGSSLRSHVSCFADWVYPVQALSLYHGATGDERSRRQARLAARRMCNLQGPDGQWWWHYDVRNGRVVEGYPVYAVHQNGMAPMALLDLSERCGQAYDESIVRGLNWMFDGPECGDGLVDERAGLIWRKVARREPGKLVRGVQATLTRIHPALRMPAADAVFPVGRIDYECRPYHLGWLLHAFSDRRMAVWRANEAGPVGASS